MAGLRTSSLGALLVVAALGASGEVFGRPGAVSANQAPRIAAFSARIGRVFEEGRGPRDGGLQVTFRLCDDGPRNVAGGRYATIALTHRTGTRRAEKLLVTETSDLITYDIHFERPECVARIPWSSTIPADLRRFRFSPCYAATLRIRDPAGRWSNARTHVVRGCVPGSR